MESKVNFYDWKRQTLRKHGGLEKTETSSMDQYGRYYKTYFCTDGTTVTEINEPEFIDVKTEYGTMHGVKVMRTECWTSREPNSVIFRELWGK